MEKGGVPVSKASGLTYNAILAAFATVEIITWFYLPDREYFFLLWTFLSLIGLVMAFKRERWWLRFRPFRVSGQYTDIHETKKGPDVDYTTAQEQGMGVDAAEHTKEKNPFAVPPKPKVVRLGMVVVLGVNIIGLIVTMICLY